MALNQSDIVSDILSGIYSDILPGIVSVDLASEFCHHFWHVLGPLGVHALGPRLSDICSEALSYPASIAHSDV